MKKIVVAVGLSVMFFGGFTGYVLAAPAPWGIAINEETEECAGYWAGDEFTAYGLPDGWEAYYPDFTGEIDTIETPVGNCEFFSEADCCEQLGYTYVSDNIGNDQQTRLQDYPDQYEDDGSLLIFFSMLLICCVCPIALLVVLIAVIAFSVKSTRVEKGVS